MTRRGADGGTGVSRAKRAPRIAGSAIPAKRSVSKDKGKGATRKTVARWTKARKGLFLERLAATSNVAESARAAGVTARAAYDLRARDPDFDAAWKAALDIGFAELEMLVLRHALTGSERTETVKDGPEGTLKQVKTVHSYPLAVALRLLAVHREEVERFRLMEAARNGCDEAVLDRIRAEMAQVRTRIAGAALDEAGDGAA